MTECLSGVRGHGFLPQVPRIRRQQFIRLCHLYELKQHSDILFYCLFEGHRNPSASPPLSVQIMDLDMPGSIPLSLISIFGNY